MRTKAHTKAVFSIALHRTPERAKTGTSLHRATARDNRRGVTTFVTARRFHFRNMRLEVTRRQNVKDEKPKA